MNWFKNYFHRPYPRSITEFRHAMVSYAQFGEDLLAQELLGYGRSDVYYIDIGAFHPIKKSNTYIFYKRGGKGICIEPNPEAYSLWKQFRPRDTFIPKGVIPQSSDVSSWGYRSNPGNAETNHIATLDKGDMLDCLHIECATIKEIILNEMPKSQQVDLLSIDCEGMDLAIIQDFPFETIRPKVAIVEDYVFSENSEVSIATKNKGYLIASYAKISKIFVDARHIT